MSTFVALVFEYRHYSFLPLQISLFRQSPAITPPQGIITLQATICKMQAQKTPYAHKWGLFCLRPPKGRPSWHIKAEVESESA